MSVAAGQLLTGAEERRIALHRTRPPALLSLHLLKVLTPSFSYCSFAQYFDSDDTDSDSGFGYVEVGGYRGGARLPA